MEYGKIFLSGFIKICGKTACTEICEKFFYGVCFLITETAFGKAPFKAFL